MQAYAFSKLRKQLSRHADIDDVKLADIRLARIR